MIIRNNNIIQPKINGQNQNVRKDNVRGSNQPEGQSFEKILNDKLVRTNETSPESDVRFSKHAELRLKSRNIELTDQQKEKLQDAVKKAGQKGIKDSLVLLDNMAFVVNVKNRTVVTALNGNELKDNVFTNIDGAVVV